MSLKERFERLKKWSEGLHWCSRCKEYLPIANFGKQTNSPFGLRSWCKDCRKRERKQGARRIRAYKQRYYQEHKADILAKSHRRYLEKRGEVLAQMAERNRLFRAKYIVMMGGECQRCGFVRFQSSLAFHHVDPTQKNGTVQAAVVCGDHNRAMAELDKCVLLCFNCHQAYHAGEWEAKFIKREGLGWTLESQQSQ